MEIVYQCLTKGAADFLVKPVRKNELKNLWQHVWRKRYRSANKGVGRAVKQTRNLVTPNSPVNSDNNMSGSNNVNDSENAASGLNINGGSDNGSGNQVSSSYSGVFSYQMLLCCQILQLRLHYGLHSHLIPVIFCFSAHFCPHLSVTYKLHPCL
jgi:hypothetical protein